MVALCLKRRWKSCHEYKKEGRGATYDSHSPDDPTASGPVLVSAPFSAFVSVLVRSGLGFIVLLLQSSCLQRFMLGQSCPPCVVFAAPRRFFPFFFKTGGSAAADSDLYSMLAI